MSKLQNNLFPAVLLSMAIVTSAAAQVTTPAYTPVPCRLRPTP